MEIIEYAFIGLWALYCLIFDPRHLYVPLIALAIITLF